MQKPQLYILSAMLILLSACKKNQMGGNTLISGEVLHHSTQIKKATVFIKFDATDFPGSDTTLYDAKVSLGENGIYNIACYKGNYYLYAYGYDYTIPAPYIVVGGIPVKTRMNEDVNMDIAVTEP